MLTISGTSRAINLDFGKRRRFLPSTIPPKVASAFDVSTAADSFSGNRSSLRIAVPDGRHIVSGVFLHDVAGVTFDNSISKLDDIGVTDTLVATGDTHLTWLSRASCTDEFAAREVIQKKGSRTLGDRAISRFLFAFIEGSSIPVPQDWIQPSNSTSSEMVNMGRIKYRVIGGNDLSSAEVNWLLDECSEPCPSRDIPRMLREAMKERVIPPQTYFYLGAKPDFLVNRKNASRLALWARKNSGHPFARGILLNPMGS